MGGGTITARVPQESQTTIFRIDLRTMELETLDQVSSDAALCGKLRVPRPAMGHVDGQSGVKMVKEAAFSQFRQPRAKAN